MRPCSLRVPGPAGRNYRRAMSRHRRAGLIGWTLVLLAVVAAFLGPGRTSPLAGVGHGPAHGQAVFANDLAPAPPTADRRVVDADERPGPGRGELLGAAVLAAIAGIMLAARYCGRSPRAGDGTGSRQVRRTAAPRAPPLAVS